MEKEQQEGDAPGPSDADNEPQPGCSRDRAPRRETIQEMIERKKKETRKAAKAASGDAPEPWDIDFPEDPYLNSLNTKCIVRRQTGLVIDGHGLAHRCEWDPNHPENPRRMIEIVDRIMESGLVELCYEIPNQLRPGLRETILAKHTEEHFEKLKTISETLNMAEKEVQASQYDSVYFNEHTFEAACHAASSALNLVFAIAKRVVMNGMAIVRPPGHHAMSQEFNGYCFFNNVAIAAEAVIAEKFCEKVLIVDFDVHHGQGTQRMFYDRNDVLYISIHRWEYGTFWPNLAESNFNYIGSGIGKGYNINIPLNATGLTDDDYLAILFYIILPVAYEFKPDIVIISAGYDAAMGCPEGQMKVTPGFYAHCVSLLHGVAEGRIAVILEGGYFIPTLAEGVNQTLKGLLGLPCPKLDAVTKIHHTVIDTVKNVRRTLFSIWECFDVCQAHFPIPEVVYLGIPDTPPFPTHDAYPVNSSEENSYYRLLNEALKARYGNPTFLPVSYVYDEQMMMHRNPPGSVERPERPERLSEIIKIFEEFGLLERLSRSRIFLRDFSEWSGPSQFESISANMPQTQDIYSNEHTKIAVHTAVSGILTIVDDVMQHRSQSGVAVIRPPGHHADCDTASGYCFVNNVAIAANYLLKEYKVKKVLIVDFDIHHGNGTQNLFYDNHQVMYISIHKDENGRFFPLNSERDYTYDGRGLGKGFNMNIPFNQAKMSDTEYLSAFQNVVLPAAYSFAPDVVLVSAGFDAGINDPLGNYTVHPETFGHMVLMLKCLAAGKLILALEGGYNLATTSYGMAISTKALLGDPVIMPNRLFTNFSDFAIRTIQAVTQHFKKYFGIFEINKF